MTNDFYQKLYIKISNFKDKYDHYPKFIIINFQHKLETAVILNNITNVYPYLTGLSILLSNRVDIEEFEIY